MDRPSKATDTRRANSPYARWAARLIEVHLGCTHDEALSLLGRHAESAGQHLDDYARLVVEGIIKFDA